MELTGINVDKIFRACLFNEGEDTSNHVLAHGVRHKVGFHPGRLEEHRGDIESMLSQLSDDFTKQGGMSFLNACITKDGEHWGEHPTVDQLVCLGLAIGKVEYCFPRESWNILPGGMPYFSVK